ncbi:MAG: cupin domain-containing protein [Candidatus Nitrosocosmicus sp.]|nr:cupin domain-containing protein [Candidatus Nitrosocosmicus sp.]
MMIDAEFIIKKLELEKHIHEGGYFKESYRSSDMISKNGYHTQKHEGEISEDTPYPERKRPASTLIYYLLVENQYSAIHRVKSDEIWHFYLGSPVTIHIINEDRISPRIQLGNNIENGENIHYIVTKDTWFCAEINNKTSFALMGCTVSPGFDFEDFELGIRDKLILWYPQHKDLIERFTKR